MSPGGEQGRGEGGRFGQVGRAVLCPPPLANERVQIDRDDPHGVTRCLGMEFRLQAVRVGGPVCGVGGWVQSRCDLT